MTATPEDLVGSSAYPSFPSLDHLQWLHERVDLTAGASIIAQVAEDVGANAFHGRQVSRLFFAILRNVISLRMCGLSLYFLRNID
jgi:hypothetical protein